MNAKNYFKDQRRTLNRLLTVMFLWVIRSFFRINEEIFQKLVIFQRSRIFYLMRNNILRNVSNCLLLHQLNAL